MQNRSRKRDFGHNGLPFKARVRAETEEDVEHVAPVFIPGIQCNPKYFSGIGLSGDSSCQVTDAIHQRLLLK